jgi:hypothetical protein
MIVKEVVIQESKKLKESKIKKRFMMELTPEQSFELKMQALKAGTTVKGMILKTFGIKA